MSVGARRASRRGWIVGAALLGLVIAKLFVVDLSNLETMARIVSFVTVGVLMLVIGYLAPLPPSEQPPGEQPGEPPGESVGTAEAVT
jgi:uncharacterized membrane protein